MGVDWCKMRLKTKDFALVKHLIEEQAIGWQEWEQTAQYDEMRLQARMGYWHFVERMPYYQHILGLGVSEEQGKKRYGDATNTLSKLLDFPEYINDGSNSIRHYTSFRVGLLSGMHVLPYLWRINAYRSYLPDELPKLFKTCKEYLDLVQAGQYRDYLFHDYLYLNSHYLYGIWHYLHYSWLNLAKTAPNAWAVRIRETDVFERIMELPKPVTQPPVRWRDWQANPSSIINYEQDERYIAIHKGRAEIQLVKDAIHKAKGKYTSLRNSPNYYEIASFDSFLSDNYAFRDELFEWWQSCIDEEYGLFMW